jgi:hypothetical protein
MSSPEIGKNGVGCKEFSPPHLDVAGGNRQSRKATLLLVKRRALD